MTILEDLALLEDGWLDGDAGKAITVDALARAAEVADAAKELGNSTESVFPTEEGGVRFYWSESENQLTVDVEPSGDVSVHTVEMMSGVFQYVSLDWGVGIAEQLEAWLL